ncbi:hypothetical protein DH2020_015750 [Rehmannia glutinosa]|uniref:Calponin-homology (CH) domain-containing protein n=1 Tax=Rehmannia glutinosa TaxID=99300 RepID=A0ABR0WTI0_REHGL
MIGSSPTSAESSFRELDEVFLQTQTRIWLGEVLNTRFDEDLNLSDLLQDGEILFEVSKVVWNLLLTKCMELRHLKHKYGPFGSRRSSGRYRPYSNVDSFIKTCKILGLSGIDLFSPSDVVEKRDIRKVPDFDMVIYSVTMPTNMVGVIRRSLETSQCTLSSSSSYSSRKVSRMKLKQKNLYMPSNEDDGFSSSEESDEAESRYMGENSFSSADGANSDIENSPERHRIKEFKHKHCKIASLSETAPSFSQQHLENDYSVVGDSSCVDVGESNYISDYLAFSDLMVHATDGSNSVIRDGENNMFDFFLNVDSQGVTSDRSLQNGSQRKLSDDEDMEVSSTTSMSSVLGRLLNLEFDDQFDEDDSLSANVRLSVSKERDAVLSEPAKVDTCETNYETVLFDSREAQSELAPRELSASTESSPSQRKCQLSGVEPLEGESYDTKTRNPGNHFCPENRDVVVAHDNQETLCFRENKDNEALTLLQYGENRVSTDFSSHISDVKSEHLKFSCNSKSVEDSERFSEQLHNINVRGFSIQDTPPIVVIANQRETISDNHPCLPVKDMSGAQEDAHVAYSIQDNIISSVTENGGEDKSLGILAENTSDERKDASSRLPPGKHGRRPLLKTVVKGTVIAGVLFLLLHISMLIQLVDSQFPYSRKSKGNNASQETKEYGQVSKYSGSKSSSTKQKKGSVGKGIYPAEKLKL